MYIEININILPHDASKINNKILLLIINHTNISINIKNLTFQVI